MTGRIASINLSDGGVPKQPVAAALICTGGVEGDRQRDLRYYGGPDRAVNLYSLDLIESASTSRPCWRWGQAAYGTACGRRASERA